MEEEMKAFVKAMMAGDERAFDEIYHSYSKSCTVWRILLPEIIVIVRMFCRKPL